MKEFIKENKNRIIIIVLVFLFQTLIYFISKLFQGNHIYLNNYLDDMIPFIPYFVIFYFLWYIFLFLIPLLILKYDKKVFDRYIMVSIIYSVLQGIIFIILPTTMDRADVVVNSISTFLVNIVYRLDTPVCNLFPSAHCAFTFLFIMSVLDLKNLNKKYKILISISSILIVLSTIFIKQHVLIDILGAFCIIVPMYYIIRSKKIDLEKSGIYAKIFRKRIQR